MKKRQKAVNDYPKFKTKQIVGLVKFALVLLTLVLVVVYAPDQAAKATGYIGMFVLGGGKIKSILA